MATPTRSTRHATRVVLPRGAVHDRYLTKWGHRQLRRHAGENGYIADSSKTYLVGEVSPLAKQLVQVTYEAMWKGIKAVRPGARLGDVGTPSSRHARRNGYSIVKGILRARHRA